MRHRVVRDGVLRHHEERGFAQIPDAQGARVPEEFGRDVVAVDAVAREVDRPEGGEVEEVDVPWIVIVWNDPINLMSYVTFVFQKLFGYSHEKAEKLMLDVHHKGKAVVSSGTREKAELDVARLHAHGLWATMEKSW